MGSILEFPADAASRRLCANAGAGPSERGAEIVILPVVRIERTPDDAVGPQDGTAPGRRRRRRARS